AVLVYSQAFPDFTIDQANLVRDGWRVEIEPAPEGLLARFDASGGRLLRITTPDDLTPGWLNDLLAFEVLAPGDDAKRERFEIPVSARISEGFLLYGQNLDDGGTLTLGRVRAGEGGEDRLRMRLRNRDLSVNIE